MTNNDDVSIEDTPKELVDWVSKNGENIRNILEEVEDFIDDRVNSEDFEWDNTDLSKVPGFIKFVLYKQWKKDHGYTDENVRTGNTTGIEDLNK